MRRIERFGLIVVIYAAAIVATGWIVG